MANNDQFWSLENNMTKWRATGRKKNPQKWNDCEEGNQTLAVKAEWMSSRWLRKENLFRGI